MTPGSTGGGPSRRVAVVGGGWAGLAAAVEATRLGARVTLFEMAGHLGGRARRVDVDGQAYDNGQHIMIGAYTATLQTMRQVGVDVDAALLRSPLRLVGPDGRGLAMPPGRPVPAFVRAVALRAGWSLRDRLTLLREAAVWARGGFECDASVTVEQLCRRLTAPVREELIDALCVAALNTPARQASARVFLRVLRDALFSGPGSADLLLPRRSLSELLPEPAARWLAEAGAVVRLSRRVERLASASGGRWCVDQEAFDAVVLAASAAEGGRLVAPIDDAWSRAAQSLRYEPIVTVYARSAGAPLSAPMLALRAGGLARTDPAQFVFDLGTLTGHEGVLAFVISGAAPWVERGGAATLQATLEQGQRQLRLAAPLQVLRSFTEKRATFVCEPGIERPRATIAPGLHAAGDHVEGPYPATLEGAVRSGLNAARSAMQAPSA